MTEYSFFEANRIGCDNGNAVFEVECKKNGVVRDDCVLPKRGSRITTQNLSGTVKDFRKLSGNKLQLKLEEDPQYSYCSYKLDFNNPISNQCIANGISEKIIPCYHQDQPTNECPLPEIKGNLLLVNRVPRGLKLTMVDADCRQSYQVDNGEDRGCFDQGRVFRAPCLDNKGVPGNMCREAIGSKKIRKIINQTPEYADILIDDPKCYGLPNWKEAKKGRCVTGKSSRIYHLNCDYDCNPKVAPKAGDKVLDKEVTGVEINGKSMKVAVKDLDCEFSYSNPSKLCKDGYSILTYPCIRRDGQNTDSCGSEEAKHIMTLPEIANAKLYSRDFNTSRAVFKVEDPYCRPQYNFGKADTQCRDGEMSYIVPCMYNGEKAKGCDYKMGPQDTVILNGKKRVVSKVYEKGDSLDIRVGDTKCHGLLDLNKGVEISRNKDIIKYRFRCKLEDGTPVVCEESQTPKLGDTILSGKVVKVQIQSDPSFVDIEVRDPNYQYNESSAEFKKCEDGRALYQLVCRDDRGKVVEDCSKAKLPEVGDKFKGGIIDEYRGDSVYIRDESCIPKFDFDNPAEENYRGKQRFIVRCRNREGDVKGCRLDRNPDKFQDGKVFQTAVADDGSMALIDVDLDSKLPINDKPLTEGFSETNTRFYWLVVFFILILLLIK